VLKITSYSGSWFMSGEMMMNNGTSPACFTPDLTYIPGIALLPGNAFDDNPLVIASGMNVRLLRQKHQAP